jgi:hypothetical protein
VDPITAAALIGGGASMLQSLLGGKAAANRAEAQAKLGAMAGAGEAEQRQNEMLMQKQNASLANLIDAYRASLME